MHHRTAKLLHLKHVLSAVLCRNYLVVRPGRVSPKRKVPDHIRRPPYISNSWFKSLNFELKKPEIKTIKQISGMRDACYLARDILQAVGENIKHGQTTDEIDIFVHNMAITNDAYPSPLDYKGFPKSVCTSVNNVGCHGIPDDRQLQNGDIINVDITVYYKGYHGDTSATFIIGDVDGAGQLLVDIARESRDAGIHVCGPGQPLSVIGAAVSMTTIPMGFNIIPEFCGHGIGDYFHGPPDIIHVDNNFPGTMLEGMTFTIEPVITEGTQNFTILEDDWTAVSTDNSRSAQFEHTILITQHGCDVLTM